MISLLGVEGDSVQFVNQGNRYLVSAAQKYETVEAWMKHAMDNETAKECEGVNIITMHSAKGLEFEVVFIVDANQGLIPSARAIKQDSGPVKTRKCLYIQ